MKIEICVDENATDLKISVICKQLTPDIEKLLLGSFGKIADTPSFSEKIRGI